MNVRPCCKLALATKWGNMPRIAWSLAICLILSMPISVPGFAATNSESVSASQGSDESIVTANPVLQMITLQEGSLTERYSDGLTVRIQSNGSRNESRGAYTKKLTIYGDTKIGYDDVVRTDLYLTHIWGPSDSRLQSRLAQYAEYYLNTGEVDKAQPLVQQYLQIQNNLVGNELGKGVALSLLGAMKLRQGEVIQSEQSLFAAAANLRRCDYLYAKNANLLGDALLANGKTNAALKQFKICLKIADKNSFAALHSEANQNYQKACRIKKSLIVKSSTKNSTTLIPRRFKS